MEILTWKESGRITTYMFNTKAEKKAAVKLLKGAIVPPSTVKTTQQVCETEVAPQQVCETEGVTLDEVIKLRDHFRGNLSEEAELQLKDILVEELVSEPVLKLRGNIHLDNQGVYKLWKAYRKSASSLREVDIQIDVKSLKQHGHLWGEDVLDLIGLSFKDIGEVNCHLYMAAFYLKQFFGKQTSKLFKALLTKPSYWMHDLGIEFREVPKDNMLVNALLKWITTTNVGLDELRLIVKGWSLLSNSDKKLASRSYRTALELIPCVEYGVVAEEDLAFAKEAQKWGYTSEQFEEALEIYHQGLGVKALFNSDYNTEIDGLVGKFLPRDDVRVGFFGEYTNCCQHYQGAGSDCAISSVKHRYSQLFVIENHKGEILCGSWVWMNESRQVCFDNIEAKGLSSKQAKTCEAIYREVARKINANTGQEVSTGLGLTDLRISGKSVNVELPEWYWSYSDARAGQVSLITEGDVYITELDNDEENNDEEDSEEDANAFCSWPRYVIDFGDVTKVTKTTHLVTKAVDIPYSVEESKLFVNNTDINSGFYAPMSLPYEFDEKSLIVKNDYEVIGWQSAVSLKDRWLYTSDFPEDEEYGDDE